MAEGNLGRSNASQRLRLDVKGIVQGVGFRPCIYRLAQKNHLTGFVLNQSGKVSIEVEGEKGDLDAFYHALKTEITAPARIDELKKMVMLPEGDEKFVIKQSENRDEATASFPADLAICDDCIAEVYDRTSRFYRYPFTSCTYCGPRYSVITRLPYDRENTSMAPFHLCAECKNDYEDPNNRRFHAQTIACPECGPQVQVLNQEGKELSGNWLERVNSLLIKDGIIAGKGIGGFHLMCEATSRSAIERLRMRKKRPRKPLALMAANIQAVEKYFEIDDAERQALQSSQAPIVLLTPNEQSRNILPLSEVAPGLCRVGVMIAYTPLHHLLFEGERELLVATSGNKSGFPITKTIEEALLQLEGIADAFLTHDRTITTRIDDSVGQVIDGRFSLIRRARGYVPDTIVVPVPEHSEITTVLGAGPAMKNTFCLLKKDKALLSQHIGDIENLENILSYQERLAHIQQLMEIQPEVVAYDPHPEDLISKNVAPREKPSLPVFHHHAHMAACMAEHQLESQVIGCILDGTGFGKDGTMWGCEILAGDYEGFKRYFHIQPLKLPGGEAAIRNPWMMGVSLIHEAMEDKEAADQVAATLFPYEGLPLVSAQLQFKEILQVSSAGRLFDGVAALLGLCKHSTYEGEAAVLLSEKMEQPSVNEKEGAYPFTIERGEWKVGAMIRAIVLDIQQGERREKIAVKFHHTVAEMVCAGVMKTATETGILPVVLSGGVWQNRYLTATTKQRLEENGFTVYTHSQVPAGDGGIALGQAAIAKWRCPEDHVSFYAGKGN